MFVRQGDGGANFVSLILQKIRTRVELYPEETVTIESMLAHEKDEEPKHATGSLTWLCRYVAHPPPIIPHHHR